MEIKKGKEENFKKIALLCSQCANESEDCIGYSFFRSLTNPREFLVYYKFKSLKAQSEHIKRLINLLGSKFPGRDLPRKFVELIEPGREEVILFRKK